MRRREGRLVSHIRKDSIQALQLRVSAGGRLITGLARCLVDERPQRRAFARWSRNALLCGAAAAKALTDSLRNSLQVVKKQSVEKQHRMCELQNAVAASARDFEREKKHTMTCWASCILRYRVRFVSIRQAQAFNTWTYKLKLQKLKLQRFHRWIMQQHQEALARSFHSWHQRSIQVWQKRAVESRGMIFFVRRQRSLQRTFVGHAFRSWQVRTQCERQAHKLLSRVALQSVHALLQSALRTWGTRVKEVEKRLRQANFFHLLLHRSLRRRLGQMMFRSFQTWAKALITRHIIRKFRTRWVLRISRQFLSSAVKSWQLHVYYVRPCIRMQPSHENIRRYADWTPHYADSVNAGSIYSAQEVSVYGLYMLPNERDFVS